jgi:predicted fused transcriptional regulator/phosphomethylpyrimidine kinase
MLVIIASVVAINAASHLVRSAANVRYEPGLITGLALWLPLGLATVYLNRAEMSSARLIFSIAIGLAISGLVEFIQAV